MSSILKALKKLEDEYPRTTGGRGSWPRTPGVKKTLRRWEINSGRFAPVLWVALTVVVLAAAAWFLIYMRSPDEPPGPSAQLPPAVSRQRSTESVRALRPAGRPATSSVPTGEQDRRPPPAATKAAAAPAAAVRAPTGAQQQRPVPSQPAKQTELQTGADLPVLQSGLELQAVSWDPSPANRIAVINGSIIREGGAIEGFSVVRIEEDEVLVRKGLSEWRLVFNIQK